MNDCFLTACPPLPLPEEIACWDKMAYDMGLPGVMLMENAARAALDYLKEFFPSLTGRYIWIFMGNGNNGGDAAAIARHLLDLGAMPVLAYIKSQKGIKGDAAKHLHIAKAVGVPTIDIKPFLVDADLAKSSELIDNLRRRLWQPYSDLPQSDDFPDICIDGLLGTGFTGTLRPDLHCLIMALNLLPKRCFTFALDIPSGLDGRIGLPRPVAIRANATATFAASKPGLALPCSTPWAGKVKVCPIGMPNQIQEQGPCSVRLLTPSILRFFQPVVAQGYKKSYGHVAIIGGANGLAGAAHLAARAAVRSGAGLVTAICPENVASLVKNSLAEIMLKTIPGKTWENAWSEELETFLASCNAIAFGPGLGRDQHALKLMQDLLAMQNRPPTVFDADALHLLAENRELLPLLTSKDILTPHPGEARALLGEKKSSFIGAEEELGHLTSMSQAAVLLKGSTSFVSQQEAPLLISPHDIPQLSVGGSGDVLAGCTAALLARADAPGFGALHAVAAAAVLHAMGGKLCAKSAPMRGNTAQEIADALPKVWANTASFED